MSDLAAFLLARIAEDERLARDAKSVWQVIGRNPKPFPGVAHHPDDWMKAEAFSLNINPFRLLAECEAKRRIVELHSDAGQSQGYTEAGYGFIEHCCATCGSFGEYGEPSPCETLRALALPYADHPDFREEWRP